MYNSLKCLQDNKGKCSKLLITVILEWLGVYYRVIYLAVEPEG